MTAKIKAEKQTSTIIIIDQTQENSGNTCSHRPNRISEVHGIPNLRKSFYWHIF